ncbi:MAG: diphthamide biosynthesis enzyme Dph2 [Candidatus Geothermarchaeales archaeon]
MNVPIEIPTDRINEEIRKRGAKRILIQAPNGIKTALSRCLPLIQSETGATTILHGESCFGACDLACVDAGYLGVDLVIHLGHTPLPGQGKGENLVFLDVYDEVNFEESLLSEILALTEGRTLGLAASTQYLGLLRRLRKTLEANHRRVMVGLPISKGLQPGQILGCDVSAAKNIASGVDGFLVVGGGVFHGLGVALWTGTETWVADPYRDALVDVSTMARKKLRLIAAKIDEANGAETFGVILGIKEGQRNLRQFSRMTEELRGMGKTVIELAMREVEPEKLRYYGWIDCFFQTLCPRISIDEIERYEAPMLSYEQFLIARGEKRFEEVYPC